MSSVQHKDTSVWEVTYPSGTRYDHKAGAVVVRYTKFTVVGSDKLQRACYEVSALLQSRAGYTHEDAQEAISCQLKGRLQ